MHTGCEVQNSKRFSMSPATTTLARSSANRNLALEVPSSTAPVDPTSLFGVARGLVQSPRGLQGSGAPMQSFAGNLNSIRAIQGLGASWD